ncbi:MAG TPA: carbohydrate ABC transporter substrate-binding protein, partial [Candidatus Pelethocola excrementipullorum]|nr:carbohydrate ABC transporter substrate-binding protein [Candidatus Pelethocola excrementipullorum]
MKRRMLAVLFTFTMTVSLLAGCGSDDVPTDASASVDKSEADADEGKKEEDTKEEDADDGASADEGKVLNIYCWNEEFKTLFETYYQGAGLLDDGIKVNFIITPSDNNAYQNALDEALLNQESAPADEKIDIFLIEADYALKYVDSDYSLDVMNDVGLTDADMSQQYQYTKDIVTDEAGAQKGTTWQATPGLFAYRRSIAKDVLGTDDPAQVQEALADWNKFGDVAEKAAGKGYKMLSGYEDSYRTFSNNMAGPWVDGNKIVIDDNLMNWVEQTKEFTDSGYNNKTALWAPEWQADQGSEGKVFGFFYSTWGINFTLMENSLDTPVAEGGKEEVGNGCYGDWAVCQGPESYFWGGTWICAAAGTDNVETVQSIMKTMT